MFRSDPQKVHTTPIEILDSNFSDTSSIHSFNSNFSDNSTTSAMTAKIPKHISSYAKILKSEYINSDQSKLVNSAQWKVFQIFKDSQLEKEFMEYFYSPKLLQYRIGFLVAVGLLILVTIYDFFTFAEGELNVKNNDVILRYLFHGLRGADIILVSFVTIILNIPYFYKRKFIAEIIIGVGVGFMYLVAIFLTISINERGLILTFFFCGFNLFHTRTYVSMIQGILSLFLYFVIAPFLEHDYFVIITTSCTILVILLVELLYSYFYELVFRKIFVANKQIEVICKYVKIESDREVSLLKNIFPKILIGHVKSKNSYLKKFCDHVIVQFDIVNFTNFCHNLRSSKIINVLNMFFTMFDEYCDEYNLEKVTTCGDGYICMSTLENDEGELRENNEVQESSKRVLLALVRMVDKFIKMSKRTKTHLDVRCGACVGDVTVAIVGTINRRFEIFGHAVDKVKKLEADCSPNKIHVDEELMSLNKDFFEFEKAEKGANNGRIIEAEKKNLKGNPVIKELKRKVSNANNSSMILGERKDFKTNFIPDEITYYVVKEKEQKNFEKKISGPSKSKSNSKNEGNQKILDKISKRVSGKSGGQKKHSKTQVVESEIMSDDLAKNLLQKKSKKTAKKSEKYKFFWPLLLFTKPSFMTNFSANKFIYENTKMLTIFSFIAFFLLEAVSFLNLALFSTFSYYYFIPIGIMLFTLLYIPLTILFHKFYYFQLYSTMFFAFIVSTIFTFGLNFLYRFTEQPEFDKVHTRLLVDLPAQFYPWMTFLFPTIPFFFKSIFVLFMNILLNIYIYFTTEQTGMAFNFLCAYVCALLGLFVFHYGTLLFFKRQRVLKEEFDFLQREIDDNENMLNTALPKVITARLLENKQLFYDDVEEGSVLFAVVKNVSTIEFESLVPFLSKLFSAFDGILTGAIVADGVTKIKSIGTDYLCVSGLIRRNDDGNNYVVGSDVDMYSQKKQKIFHVAKLLNEKAKEILRKKKKKDTNFSNVYVIFSLHTGSFSGGVLGKTKIIYDIVGDAINVCHRYSNDFFKSGGIQCSEVFIEEKHLDRNDFVEKDVFLKGAGDSKVYKLVE